ncbi:YeiH family protein [Halegenticoccus tardaugens]|uniref:YeiH family protein n=1 Tax=Halegenticoccus tardaugens TaxID=2071624 RepID=UPI00100B028F|nr:putative sulfate exporter family transporter [Halegenticoccus tardaugens]
MVALRTLVPGIALLITIGLAGRAVAFVFPSMNYLIVVILIGLLVGNSYGVPEWARAGVRTHQLWLEVGIVVMGAGIVLDNVIAAGPALVVLVIGTVAVILLMTEIVARKVVAIPAKTGSLLAAGASICGVSAVVSVAGSIQARERDIAYAAATVLLFDAVTLFIYPIVGHALGLSDTVFGIWAGLTMFSTGPVAAAGFSFSETAGEWALLVKLIRNALIGLVAVGYAMYYARRARSVASRGTVSNGLRGLWDTFPKFVLGFFLVMLIANTGILRQEHLTSLEHASNWLFMLAFAGLGLEIRVAELRSTGFEPILVVLLSLLLVSTGGLLILTAIF